MPGHTPAWGRLVMEPERPPPDAVDRSDLVAYLDGELSDAEARAIAERVSRSPAARLEVEALRGAWDLLDLLPSARASTDLGSRTLSAVRRVAEPEVAPSRRTVPRPLRIATCAAALILMVGLGFVAGRWAWPDRTSRLVKQLSLAEHLDEYRDVGSVEFLQALDRSPEFGEAE